MTRFVSGRVLLRGLAFAGVAAAGYAFGVTSDSVSAQPVARSGVPPVALPGGAQPQPKVQPIPAPEADKRVVAYITNASNNTLIPITREELGEYILARGGHEKLALYVNKRIIEIEAARRGVTVTTAELKVKLEDVLRGLGISLKDFEDHVLPKYKKSLYEYVEDVLKSEILLTKMCRDRVKITDEDLQKAFENKFGERRQAKVICWNKTDLRAAEQQWSQAIKGDAEFDAIAKMQAERSLAASAGLVAPVGKYSEVEDNVVERTLFSLKQGELSQLFTTQQGIICVKLHAIIPPDKTVQFDEKMKAALRNELFAKRIDNEIGKFFAEIKTAAKPNLLLTGSPSAAEFREGVGHIVNQVGAPPVPMVPGALPPVQP